MGLFFLFLVLCVHIHDDYVLLFEARIKPWLKEQSFLAV